MAHTSFFKAKAFLLLLAAVILFLSIPTLALAAHGVAHYWGAVSGGQFDYVRIHIVLQNVAAQTSTAYTTSIAYQPYHGLDMGDMYAILIAGILGTLLGLTVFVASLWKMDSTVVVSLTGRTARPFNILGTTTIFALDATLLITFVCVAGYAWAKTVSKSEFLNPENVSYIQERLSYYNTNEFTFERWNCALAHAAVSSAKDPTRGELYELCKEAAVARKLVMVLVALALARLVVHFWVWRKHNVAVRMGKADGRRNGVDVRAKEESWYSSGEQSRHACGETKRNVVELPAYRSSRIEAPDTAVGEMRGENGFKELHGETVASEMDGSRRS